MKGNSRAVRPVERLPGGTDILRVAGPSDISGLDAGITVRPADFGLVKGGSAGDVSGRYERLAFDLGFGAAAVCRQVHGTRLVDAAEAPAVGTWIAGEADGFVGAAEGRLFAVTVADCVPVYVVDPGTRAFALLHAGWRGAAAGILERALRALREAHGRPPEALRVHLGPAICGDCYEVGPEVPRAFGRGTRGPTSFDIRTAIAGQAEDLGVPPEHVTRSDLCTRCENEILHSYRAAGGRAGRMVAWLGWHAR